MLTGEDFFSELLTSEEVLHLKNSFKNYLHRKRHHSPSKSEEAVATTTEEECYLKFDSSQSMQNHIESQHGDANKAAVVSNDWRGLGIPSSYATTDQHENRGDAQMEIAGIVGHEEIVQPHFANEVLLAQTDDSNVSHPSHELLAAAESGNALIVSGPEDSSTSLMLLSSFMPGYDFDHQSATGLPEIGTNPQVEQVFPQHNQPQTQPPTLTSGGAIIGSFSCSLCQKKFASQKAKNQHERLVHAKVRLFLLLIKAPFFIGFDLGCCAYMSHLSSWVRQCPILERAFASS